MVHCSTYSPAVQLQPLLDTKMARGLPQVLETPSLLSADLTSGSFSFCHFSWRTGPKVDCRSQQTALALASNYPKLSFTKFTTRKSWHLFHCLRFSPSIWPMAIWMPLAQKSFFHTRWRFLSPSATSSGCPLTLVAQGLSGEMWGTSVPTHLYYTDIASYSTIWLKIGPLKPKMGWLINPENLSKVINICGQVIES